MTTLESNMWLVWAIIGIGLLIAEITTGAFVLLFFGVSALLVAAGVLLGLNNLAYELLIFSLLGLGGLVVFRRRLKETFSPSNRGGYSIDTQSTFRLSDPVSGRSEAAISYQGTKWTAVNEGEEELPAGSYVIVTRIEGIKLHIKKLNS